MGWGRLIGLTTALALAGAAGVAAQSDGDIIAVYDQILDDPGNTELNLQYALLAEGRGEYRKALGTYERILINDPSNAAAQRGLLRVRRDGPPCRRAAEAHQCRSDNGDGP